MLIRTVDRLVSREGNISLQIRRHPVDGTDEDLGLWTNTLLSQGPNSPWQKS